MYLIYSLNIQVDLIRIGVALVSEQKMKTTWAIHYQVMQQQ